MAMMDKMMKVIIGRMSIEKKQEMMLKMMPMMMTDVNMAETMIKMMPQMLDHISLNDIFQVLKNYFPKLLQGIHSVGEFIARWNELFPKIMKKIPEVMETMLPVMEVVMPAVMGVVLPLMMSQENLNRMEKCAEQMAPKMMKHDKLKEIIPQMMARIFPHCLENMLPLLPSDKQKKFSQSLKKILDQTN